MVHCVANTVEGVTFSTLGVEMLGMKYTMGGAALEGVQNE